jgi:TPR repeat protein
MTPAVAEGERKMPRAAPRPKIRLSPVGFWSYSRRDDEFSRGRLSQLRSLLLAELQTQYGRDGIQLFQDVSTIPHGADWERITTGAIDQSTFFIPIVTPFYMQSRWCARETKMFEAREEAIFETYPDLSRDRRRIFPLLWIDVSEVEAVDEEAGAALKVAQWCDFSRLRHRNLDHDEEVLAKVAAFAKSIVDLLQFRVAAPIGDEERGPEPKPPAAEAKRPSAEPRGDEDAAGPRRPDAGRRSHGADEVARNSFVDRVRDWVGQRKAWMMLGAAAFALLAIFSLPRLLDGGADRDPPSPAPAAEKPASGPPGRPITPVDPRLAARNAISDAAGRDWSATWSNVLLPRLLGKAPFSAYLSLAQSGDARAQWVVGQAYFDGLGVGSDLPQALSWFRRAAEQGEPRAQNSLGAIYRTGIGVPRDSAAGVRYLRSSADQGNALAQRNLAAAYRVGAGVPVDHQMAMRLYRMAADQGEGHAFAGIGFMYEGGLGVPPDARSAVIWYRRGAESGDPDAHYYLALLLYRGAPGVARDENEARLLMGRAARAGNGEATRWLNEH